MDAEAVRDRLTQSGLVLLAFELVKKLIVRRVKDFYADTTFGRGLPFQSYEQDVLSRHKIVFEASLRYLRDHMQAIDAEDERKVQGLREYRNRIAHDLPNIIVSMSVEESSRILKDARDCLFKLSNFWVYIDIGADPDFRDQGIDWDTVAGSEFMLLDEIIRQLEELK